jgi:hypothetical protein
MGRYDRWTQEEDNRLIELYNAGLTSKQIGENLNRTEKGVNSEKTRLVKRGLLKPRKILKTPKYYYKYNFDNLTSLNPLCTYLIITILCDGHIRQRNLHFSFRNRDIIEFRKTISHILKMNFPPRIIPMKKYNWSKFYLHSKALSDLLQKRYSLPIGAKSGKIKISKEILECNDPKIHGAVMRACYDCEGSVNLRKDTLHFVIANTSKEFLQDLKKIMNGYGINSKIYGIILLISSLDSLVRFYNLAYKIFDLRLYVNAKKSALEKLIEMKESRGCLYTNFFNEIEFKKMLKELIRRKFILKYPRKELKKWLEMDYNINIKVARLTAWTNKDKIIRVFGKSREEIIEELKME